MVVSNVAGELVIFSNCTHKTKADQISDLLRRLSAHLAADFKVLSGSWRTRWTNTWERCAKQQWVRKRQRWSRWHWWLTSTRKIDRSWSRDTVCTLCNPLMEKTRRLKGRILIKTICKINSVRAEFCGASSAVIQEPNLATKVLIQDVTETRGCSPPSPATARRSVPDWGEEPQVNFLGSYKKRIIKSEASPSGNDCLFATWFSGKQLKAIQSDLCAQLSSSFLTNPEKYLLSFYRWTLAWSCKHAQGPVNQCHLSTSIMKAIKTAWNAWTRLQLTGWQQTRLAKKSHVSNCWQQTLAWCHPQNTRPSQWFNESCWPSLRTLNRTK